MEYPFGVPAFGKFVPNLSLLASVAFSGLVPALILL